MANILFIDDDAAGRKMAAFSLRKLGHTVDEAADGDQGLKLFDVQRHELVVTDLRMPGLSGIELTRALIVRAPDLPVLVITAFGKIETAVQAMQAGAFDFVLKPFSRDQLRLVVERALEHRRLLDENRSLRRKVLGVERDIVFQSAAMR